MNRLKQNGFWVVCGVLGALLLGFFGLVVFPKYSEADALRTQVRGFKGTLDGARDKGVPSKEDVQGWIDRQEQCKKDFQEIANLYAEKDKALEQWFPTLQGLGRDPQPGEWASAYVDAARELEESLRKLKIEIGVREPTRDENEAPRFARGFNWEKVREIDWGPLQGAEKEVIRLLQKRFWIAHHVADACVAVEGADQQLKTPLARRIRDVSFFGTVHANFKSSEAFATTVPAPEYTYGWTEAQTRGMSRFREFELNKKWGTTITFGVEVDLPFENIPRFLQQVLDASKIIVNIVACRIYLPEQNEPQQKVTLIHDHDNMPMELRFYGEDPTKPDNYRWDKDKDAWNKPLPHGIKVDGTKPIINVTSIQDEAQKAVKPMDARVLLTCQALDTTPSSIQEALAPKPTP